MKHDNPGPDESGHISGDILIVDDNPESLRLLSEILSRVGYKTRPAPSGELALRALESIEPDLILLDIRMPNMDGYEVCRRLKEQERTRQIPVLFISGLSDTEDKVKGFAAGAVDYIIKPFQEEEILARVHTHVTLSRLHRKLEQMVDDRTRELVSSIQRLDEEIQERKRAQEELAKNSAFIESILENIPDIVTVVDAEQFRFVRVNRAAEQLFQVNRENILGKSLTGLFSSEHAEFYREKYSEVLTKKELVDIPDGRMIDAAGNRHWLHTKKIPLTDPDGKIEYIISVCEDITEKKQVKEERRRLAEAVSQLDESVVITDRTGAILFVNPAFERITGYSREEVLGLNPRILKSGVHADSFFEEMWQSLLAGKTWKGEITNRKKNGDLFVEKTTISPIFDDQGNIVTFIAVKDDVTEQRALEDQLHHAQKMETVGRLAGGVAHDFNNMLCVILGTVQLLMMDQDENNPILGDLRQIQQAARRSADITRQLLAFSRKQVIDPKVININPLIKDVTKMLGRLLGEDIDILFFPEPDLYNTKVDSGQLHQIITNLAINARDAMPDGGKLTLETANTIFDDAYCRVHAGFQPGTFVMLAISDNGTGIDPEIMPHIFEPFFTTKEQDKGTGLGLASVYGAVKHGNGYINVYSEPGQGTCFKLYFPACIEKKAAPLVEEEQREEGMRRLTILLVEDDEMVRRLTENMLVSLGHGVLLASTPDQALDICIKKGADIDLLISDVILPGMTGRQLFGQIQKIVPGMRVLYMSGYTANVIAHQGVLDRDIIFLQKPFSIQELEEKIRTAAPAAS
jgi:PAS domain S-box-containing protein